MSIVINEPLEERQLALAEVIVERAASYDERLHEEPQAQEATAKLLSIEYTIVRIALVGCLN